MPFIKERNEAPTRLFSAGTKQRQTICSKTKGGFPAPPGRGPRGLGLERYRVSKFNSPVLRADRNEGWTDARTGASGIEMYRVKAPSPWSRNHKYNAAPVEPHNDYIHFLPPALLSPPAVPNPRKTILLHLKAGARARACAVIHFFTLDGIGPPLPSCLPSSPLACIESTPTSMNNRCKPVSSLLSLRCCCIELPWNATVQYKRFGMRKLNCFGTIGSFRRTFFVASRQRSSTPSAFFQKLIFIPTRNYIKSALMKLMSYLIKEKFS